MKSINTLSILTAALAILASTALADDPQLQNRLAAEQARHVRTSGKATTVAAYANRRGVGRSDVRSTGSDSRFELRSHARGQNVGAFVPANR